MSDNPESLYVTSRGLLANAPFLADENVRKVFALLNRDGEEARVVGGATRDALIGEAVREIDFATTALPGVVAARAQAQNIRTVPTGLEFGTVTLLINGQSFEVTTLREDLETDGRRAIVRFGRSFARDALRRDFTVNALSTTLDGTVHDYVGGLNDLAKRRIRFIGDPAARIREDYLRSLRFFRFYAQFSEDGPDAGAIRAVIEQRNGLQKLSKERVRAELLKLFAGRRALEAFQLMSDLGLVGLLLGSVAHIGRLSKLIALESILEWRPDPLLRLAAATVAVCEDGDRLRDLLRLSRAEAIRLIAAGRIASELHGRRRAPNQDEILTLLLKNGRRACIDGLALVAASLPDSAAKDAWIDALRRLPKLSAPAMPFGGADIIARGVPPGRQLGEILKDLQARWIRSGFPRDATVVARLIDEATRAVSANGEKAVSSDNLGPNA